MRERDGAGGEKGNGGQVDGRCRCPARSSQLGRVDGCISDQLMIHKVREVICATLSPNGCQMISVKNGMTFDEY
ncbi:hypothetical protein F2P81_023958 [Scophthalmus maximus]|nr:hypothetical protein F2P81_023958 [Scophthalmus maximus]